MSVTAIKGNKGSGKTLYMVKRLWEYQQQGYQVYSNIKLGFKYTPISVKGLLTTMFMDIKNCVIGLDEMQIYADCRMSMSQINKTMTYLILQSRKRHVHIFYTTQQLHNVDKRLRRNTEHIFHCDPFIKYNGGMLLCDGSEITPEIIKLTHIKTNTLPPEITEEYLIDPETYFPLYNTDEIVDISEFMQQKKSYTHGNMHLTEKQNRDIVLKFAQKIDPTITKILKAHKLGLKVDRVGVNKEGTYCLYFDDKYRDKDSDQRHNYSPKASVEYADKLYYICRLGKKGGKKEVEEVVFSRSDKIVAKNTANTKFSHDLAKSVADEIVKV